MLEKKDEDTDLVGVLRQGAIMTLGKSLAVLVSLVIFVPAELRAQLQFQPLVKRTLPADNEGSYHVAAGDVDGDGDADLFYANTRGQSRLYLNDGNGNLSDATSTRIPLGWLSATAVALVDVDGDQDLDIILAVMTGGQTRLYKNDGGGRFTDMTATHMPIDFDNSFTLVVADFDGDLDPDLYLGNNGGQNKLYINDGSGVFTDQSSRLPIQTDLTYEVTAVDVDGDLDLDIVVANILQQNRVLIYDSASRMFADETSTRFPLVADETFSVSAGDFDGDGDQDLVFGTKKAQNILYINKGGVFHIASNRLPSITDSAFRMLVHDFDHDGDQDLFVVARAQNSYLENDGIGNFIDKSSSRIPSTILDTTGGVLVDLDCDGDLDVAMGAWGQQNEVWFNHHRQTYSSSNLLIGQSYSLDFYSQPGYAILPTAIAPAVSIGGILPKIPLPQIGLFGLNPATFIGLPLLVIQAPGGKASITFPVPNDPGIRGLDLYSQALSVELPLGPRLTNLHMDRAK